MGEKFKIGYLVKTVYDNAPEDLTAEAGDVLATKTFYGKDKERKTGTIQKYEAENGATSITLKELLDMKQNADYLFYNYKGETIPLNASDTENVISMNGMFQNCDVSEIPSLNMDNVQYMNNIYRGATAETIGAETPQPAMFRMSRRSLSNIDQFMQEIGKLDEWKSIKWSNIPLNENIKGISGLLVGATNVKDVKIINNSIKTNKLYAEALGNNQSLKNFWVTNCDNIEDGIDNIVRNCPALETLVLENATSERTIYSLDGYEINSPLKYLYIDGLRDLVSTYGFVSDLENLEYVKLLGCTNVENLATAADNNEKLISYVLENPHNKNISMTKFTTYKENNITYNVPYLSYFEPGCIFYSIDYERYYKIKENKTFERITGSIEDYINKNGGIDTAPRLTINQSMNNRSNLLQASLDCFLKGAILYSTVDQKYYKKDLINGDWIVIDEPLNYPLKQSFFTLKNLSYAFYKAKNLEKFEVSDATDIGKLMKTNNFNGYSWSMQSERDRSLQCKGYKDNYDLPTNYDKLKYFAVGTIFHWLDDDKYYQIDENHNAVEINPIEYLKNNDIFPAVKTDYSTYRNQLGVNINFELDQFYRKYYKKPTVADNVKGAFVYDQHSRSFFKIHKLYIEQKPINEIDISKYANGEYVISKEKICYKKVNNSWVKSSIFYTLPADELTGNTKYGTEEISLDTYLNTLFVFETDSFFNTGPEQEMLEDFGVDNVIRTTNNGKLYKIVYNESYDIEEIDETYLENKNTLKILVSGYYGISIKESINFNPTVKHFEINGVVIGNNRFGSNADWQDFWFITGSIEKAFEECYKLKTLILPGISVSFDISASTAFEENDIKTIFENLGKANSPKEIKLNKKYSNLSQEIKNIAINKGWTIAF